MRIPAVLVAAAFFCVGVRAQERVASARTYHQSFFLGPAQATYLGMSAYVVFTTYDGSTAQPLVDRVGDLYIGSGENAPRTGSNNTYDTDYLVWLDGTLNAWGTVEINVPITDSSADGVPDFLQRERSGSVQINGTLRRQYPISGTYPCSGSLSRASGAEKGTYAVKVTDEYGTVTYGGEFQVFASSGALTYVRAVTGNSGTLQLDEQSAQITFVVQGSNTLTIPQFFLPPGGGKPGVTVKALTLSRTGRQYRGVAEVDDGNAATSWPDYLRQYVVLADDNDADSDGIPDLSDGIAPTIVSQPQSQTRVVGESATFSVAAQAVPAPSFQWYFNDEPVSDATGASLCLADLAADGGGAAHVRVSNSEGVVTSAVATLSVMVPGPFTNGSFETVTINPSPDTLYLTNGDKRLVGWTIKTTDAPVSRYRVKTSAVDFNPMDGAHHLAFNAGNRQPGATLSQSFATLPDQDYEVSFSVARAGDGTGTVRLTANVSSTSGQSLGNLNATPPSHGYGERQTLAFTPATAFTTLTFTDTSSSTVSVDVVLDHVTVNVVKPRVWLDSSSGIGVCWDSLPGRVYQVQQCSDLNMGDWQELGAQVVGDGNTLRVGAPVDGERQHYYRVVRLP